MRSPREQQIHQLVSGHHNIVTATGNVRIVYELPEAVGEDRTGLLVLLNRVKEFWLTGLLSSMLEDNIVIELPRQSKPEMVANPWENVLDDYDILAKTNTTCIADQFMKSGMSLLICGYGKTTELLLLCKWLNEKARNDPLLAVPVVLSLASWSDKEKNFSEWIYHEMQKRYFIPKRITKRWINNSRLLVMLDSLDEVPSGRRIKCIQSINDFGESNPLPGIVVCSRTGEYLSTGERLKLNGAIELQPLSKKSIYKYIENNKLSNNDLKEYFDTNENIVELASSILMLNMIVQLSGELITEQKENKLAYTLDISDTLIKKYMNNKIKQKKRLFVKWTEKYTMEKISYISKHMISHMENIIDLDNLQPSWFQKSSQRRAYIYTSRMILCVLLGLGLTLALLFDTESGSPILEIGIGVCWGLCGGITTSFLDNVYFKNTEKRSSKKWLISYLSICLLTCVGCGAVLWGVIHSYWPLPPEAQGIDYWIFDGITWAILFTIMFRKGSSTGIVLQDIRTTETMSFKWQRSLKGLFWAGMLGAIVGLFAFKVGGFDVNMIGWSMLTGVILIGIPVAAIFGFQVFPYTRIIKPNIGMKIRARKAITISLLVLAMIMIPFATLIFYRRYYIFGDTIQKTLHLAIMTGIAWGLYCSWLSLFYFGIIDIGKHIILRKKLAKYDLLPSKVDCFMEHCAKIGILKPMGSGYVFIHETIRNCFTNIDWYEE